MGTKLNLNDFNIENQNIINEEETKKEVPEKTSQAKVKKAMKREKLEEKMQVSLTKNEHSKLYSDFESSGFTSFAGYIRMKLKEIRFI